MGGGVARAEFRISQPRFSVWENDSESPSAQIVAYAPDNIISQLQLSVKDRLCFFKSRTISPIHMKAILRVINEVSALHIDLGGHIGGILTALFLFLSMMCAFCRLRNTLFTSITRRVGLPVLSFYFSSLMLEWGGGEETADLPSDHLVHETSAEVVAASPTPARFLSQIRIQQLK